MHNKGFALSNKRTTAISFQRKRRSLYLEMNSTALPKRTIKIKQMASEMKTKLALAKKTYKLSEVSDYSLEPFEPVSNIEESSVKRRTNCIEARATTHSLLAPHEDRTTSVWAS